MPDRPRPAPRGVSRPYRPRLRDLARATVELAVARLALRRPLTSDMVGDETTTQTVSLDPRQRAVVEAATFVVPRVAHRLPWRSDCLVQALAARRWLGAAGIATRLMLGARKSPSGLLEAHAWLTVAGAADGVVVTGGDISSYVPFARR
jgi:hypothetical protein